MFVAVRVAQRVKCWSPAIAMTTTTMRSMSMLRSTKVCGVTPRLWRVQRHLGTQNQPQGKDTSSKHGSTNINSSSNPTTTQGATDDQAFHSQVDAFRTALLNRFKTASARTIIANTNFDTLGARDAVVLRSRVANAERSENNMSTFMYAASVVVVSMGLAWLAVPLYRLICTESGLDGTPIKGIGDKFDRTTMVPMSEYRPLKIRFASSVNPGMNWKFVPETPEITVVPGETTLAFYKAENKADKDVIGFSTYSVDPMKAAQYFNKIQCFCFEEQKLNAHEEVDMPVFFFIDPEFANDPLMKDVKTITLHYTFFKSKDQ